MSNFVKFSGLSTAVYKNGEVQKTFLCNILLKIEELWGVLKHFSCFHRLK